MEKSLRSCIIAIAIVIGLPILISCSSDQTQYDSSVKIKIYQHKNWAIHHSLDKMGAAFFSMMDENNDGIVTREERDKSPHQEWMVDFSKVDLNGDGKLMKEEYIKALKINHPMMSGHKA